MSILEDMHLFVEVSNARSFTRAAAVLDMPVSTLSKRIKRLEEAVGVRLFSRSTRIVELTELGATYYDTCRRIVGDAQSAHEALAGLAAAPTGLLRVALPVDFSTAFLDVPIVRFIKRYPNVHLHLDLTSRRVDPIAESFDVVIRIGHPADSGFIAHHLAELTQHFYANADIASELSSSSTPLDLDPTRCIGLAGNTIETWNASNGVEDVALTPAGPISANNVGLLRRLVEKGAGVSVFAEPMVRTAIASGALVRILPAWQIDPTPVYAFTQSRMLPAKIRLFVRTLADALRDGI
ncbi:LysR family transcriptional regulator [Caballeronia sordidicola]|uniref:LysR family transcriptional regulator n=1 Tax=Caballeronia sordidicola TaxID=196367 RepID=UPI0004D03196|nr:LysR family transcriptional regulator [Caballeronia sordidicola]